MNKPDINLIIQTLIKYLDTPDNDYWYDSISDIARNLIDENCEYIFPLLLAEWSSWPATRQEHLAYILGEGNSTQEIELINTMLFSPYKEVVFRVRESLVNYNKSFSIDK